MNRKIILLLIACFTSMASAELRKVAFSPDISSPIIVSFQAFPGRENPDIQNVEAYFETNPLPGQFVSSMPEKLVVHFRNRDSVTIKNFKSFEENQYFAVANNFWLFKKNTVSANTHFNEFDSMGLNLDFYAKDGDLLPTADLLSKQGYITWAGMGTGSVNNSVSSRISVQHDGKRVNISAYKYLEKNPDTNNYEAKFLVDVEGKEPFIHFEAASGNQWDTVLTSTISSLSTAELSLDVDGNQNTLSVSYSHTFRSGQFGLTSIKEIDLTELMDDQG